MTFEEADALEARLEELGQLSEIMQEPPGGHNYGRKRGVGGGSELRSPLGSDGWIDLTTRFYDVREADLTVDAPEEPYHRSQKPADTIRHGTLSAYTNDRCRCELCRKSKADYERARRRV